MGRTNWRPASLLLIDNQIDQLTSTIRLKARFPNADGRLWPGEFVRVRAQVDAKEDVVTIPAPALQRGPNGALRLGHHGGQHRRPAPGRSLDGGQGHGHRHQGAECGREGRGERAYRLQKGTRVEAKPQSAQQAAAGDRS